jgi:NADH-quinone oxidoreductase subunit N
MHSIVYILPEIFLSLAIMFLLMLGVFVKKSFNLVDLLTILSLIFAIALVLNQPDDTIKIFSESYIIDRLSII